MIEKTLVLIKPDAVQRNLIGEIISRFEKVGLKIIGMKMVHPTKEQTSNHYIDDESWLKSVGQKRIESYAKKGINIKQKDTEIGKEVREQLMLNLSSSPIIAIALEGHNAVLHIRKMVGATEPASSNPGTIRGDFSLDTYTLADDKKRPIQNLIHASGTVEEAQRELIIWFTNNELHTWRRLDEHILH